MPRRLLLMRHGETVWNQERRFTTRTDVPLSEAGEVQAAEAARRLAGTVIDRIYSSPLGRVSSTLPICVPVAPWAKVTLRRRLSFDWVTLP